MQEPFNPYLQWLSIEGSGQPANHYELLGIEFYEGDAEIIAHAADVRTAQVRSIRPGAHVIEWQRLLDELNEAKACLLDAHAKAAYDAAVTQLMGQPGGIDKVSSDAMNCLLDLSDREANNRKTGTSPVDSVFADNQLWGLDS